MKTCLDGIQSKMRIGNYLSSIFPSDNSLKPSLLLNFVIVYAIMEVQETKLSVILGYADDVNLIGDDTRTIERNVDALLNACKDIGLGVNTSKTEYMEVGSARGMIANENIVVGNNSYEKFKTFE